MSDNVSNGPPRTRSREQPLLGGDGIQSGIEGQDCFKVGLRGVKGTLSLKEVSHISSLPYLPLNVLKIMRLTIDSGRFFYHELGTIY